MSARIVYKDLAVGAAEDAALSMGSGGLVSFADLSLLPFPGERTHYPSLEHNRWTLDGSFEVPDEPVAALWSEQVSDAAGGLTGEAVRIDIAFTRQYTATGLTVSSGADAQLGELLITWYRGGTPLAVKYFHPDARVCFCEALTEGFDRITIQCLKTALPYRRARLDYILFGALREFGIDQLGDVKPTFEVDPTSRTLAENTLDWHLASLEKADYLFQEKQPVLAYNGSRLLGTFYIRDSSRTGERQYDISCTDAIGVLGGDKWPDAVYSDKNAYELACEICAPFGVEMDDAFKSETVTGILKDKTRRQALQQLCFRLGAAADTSGSESIRVFALKTDAEIVVGPERTRLRGSVRTADTVTAISLTTHAFSRSGDSNEVEINGVKYYDTQVVHTLGNPDVVSSDKPNVVEITDATLVTEAQADAILERLADYYANRQTHAVRFRVEDEAAGDHVRTNTPWNTAVVGTLQKLSMSVKGIAVADAEVVGASEDLYTVVFPYSGRLYSAQTVPYLGVSGA